MVTPARPRGPRPGRAKAPPSTLVLLVRHGSTPSTGQVLPGRAAGLHLADSGRQQAQLLAARLVEWAPPGPDGLTTRRGRPRRRIDAVYASPMERTKETAQPIGSALGLPVQIARGLVECDFGDWTGANLKDLAKLPEWATIQRYPSGFRFPGGESFASMQARMLDTIADLCSRHRGSAIVAVSHADPIKAAVADALGTHLDLFQRILISPCSVTAVTYGPLGPAVLAVNSTGALGDSVGW
ncbi:MAG: histidine phosphatase family protein [Acidimicrobiales bacterium]